MPRENPKDKLIRLTENERELWAKGETVAGIDEVGRGPLVGPVVCCCIIIPEDQLIEGVDDSKKLSPKRREALFDELIQRASYVCCAEASPREIDECNILNATKRCMEECAKGALGAHFLIDAVSGLSLPGEATPIIHGDALSYMIAAASIVAKVTRDRMMLELDKQYPMYGFAKNKGYGTAEHIAALKRYGPCREHRNTFIKKILAQMN